MIKKIRNSFEHFAITNYLFKWTLLVIPVAFFVGSMVALFLWLLAEATSLRMQQPWLLYLLPLAGIVIYMLYKYLGKNSEGGNNLIMDKIHSPGGGVPARMTPLVLITTIITHLFGGSAGREGTAVQMGGSLAGLLARWTKLNVPDTRILLMTGIAAGFGAVFGTPVTGAIFALEVLAVGKINHRALMPCFIASVLADITCTAYGIQHTTYQITYQKVIGNGAAFLLPDFLLLMKVMLAGVCFGLAGYLFSEMSHTIKNYSNRFIKINWLIPVIGGLLIIALSLALGTTDYLGLGVTNPDSNAVSIVSSFKAGGAGYFSWWWKIVFTSITLGMGFKGGEVTPLFFIGAALGNTYAMFTGAPIDLMAGLGFIAVFAAATNTPIACTLMGVELFGGDYTLYYAVACFTAYYFSGHSGIYQAQRVSMPKINGSTSAKYQTLKDIREQRIRQTNKWLKNKGFIS